MAVGLRVYMLCAVLQILIDAANAGAQFSPRRSINNSQPIDLSKMPSCLLASCSSDPLGSARTDACTPTKPSTQLYDRSCYCALKDPLSCAWSCSWWDWMATEDWFVSECGPESDDLSYDGLPACAHSCLYQKLVYYGCVTEGRNCFCIHGSLFDCQSNCHKESERTAIKHWLMDRCGVSAELGDKGADTGIFYGSTDADSESRQSPVLFRSRRKELKWYEIFAIVLLCGSFLVGGLVWIDLRLRQRRRNQPSQARPHGWVSSALRENPLSRQPRGWKALPGDGEA